MLPWLLSILAGLLATAIQYGRSATVARTMPLALLRALAVTLVVALRKSVV